jgi:hypothetical protein
MTKKAYTLQPSELEIFRLAAEDPNIFTNYFFKAEGEEKGFEFDYGFTENGAWQKSVHHAVQTDIIVIGGFGTGKTLGVGMSAAVWAATTPNFKFLNVCQKAWQAKQMYDSILLLARGTPFEKLVVEQPRRPFPKIVIRFIIDGVVVESSLEFMSADKNATGILSWEGDWINVDEAGLLDNLEEIVTALGSRLRGTVRGRERLGRLSMTSNSWDNHYMWSYFDQATADPAEYLSLVVSTRDNKNVTPRQLEKMLKRIPEDERQRFIDGTRPEGRGNFFAKDRVYACEDYIAELEIETRIKQNTAGYGLEKLRGLGVAYFETQKRKNELYVLMGDPGIDSAPKRNSPVLMVWGVPAEFPKKPARLAAFWWGNGHGHITPFVDWLLRFKRTYNPISSGVDATGPQKNMAELINIQYLGQEDDIDYYSDLKILPMDFSGSKKAWYLQALRLFIEAEKLSWPKFAVGIRSQLTNYDVVRDKKIAQDIVATMAMSAFAIRSYFNVEPSDYMGDDAEKNMDESVSAVHRQARSDTSGRTRRSRFQIPVEYCRRQILCQGAYLLSRLYLDSVLSDAMEIPLEMARAFQGGYFAVSEAIGRQSAAATTSKNYQIDREIAPTGAN